MPTSLNWEGDKPAKVRKLLYYSLYIPSMVVTSVLLITLGMLLPVRLRQKYGAIWNCFVSRTALYWVYGIRVQVQGAENLPSGPFVAVANHQCEWETLFLGWQLRPIFFVLKRELLRIPFFGWGLRASGAIGIDRSKPREAIRQIEQAGTRTIRKGRNMLLFPEGTRVAPGEYRRFTRTAAKMAVDCQVPLLPIAHDAGEHWSPSGKIKPGGTIHLWIGNAIDPQGHNAKSLTDISENWIREKAGLARE